jgi:hypothetical protein
MATQMLSPQQRSQLAARVRERYLAEAGLAMRELSDLVLDRLTAALSESGTTQEIQKRSDAWSAYRENRAAWVAGTHKAWAEGAQAAPKKKDSDFDISVLTLEGEETVEHKIIASRLVTAVVDTLGAELNDLHHRIKHIEERAELAPHDMLRLDVLLLAVVEQWAASGMPQGSWHLIQDVVRRHFVERIKTICADCNKILIDQGVLPTVEAMNRVKRPAAKAPSTPDHRETGADGRAAEHPADEMGSRQGVGGEVPRMPGVPQAPSPPQRRSGPLFGGRLGWGADPAGAATGSDSATQGPPFSEATSGPPMSSAHDAQSPYAAGGVHEETRMMTQATPMGRARMRAQGVIGQLKRLLVKAGGSHFDSSDAPHAPSPALAAAIARRPAQGRSTYEAAGDTIEDFSPAGVEVVANRLREQTVELKKKAGTQAEKATIEIVALMFQSILAEERIAPAIRVWIARLQMPVLRVALAEPEFFGTLNHPARQLIDRIGSCAMGFDAGSVTSEALEAEMKRIVQVIEQYPETGRRVFELMYEEFQKFLTRFLTDQEATKQVVGVAQQIEEKETLTVQYTIELRNMLKDMPVRDEIRGFLFKVWAEVLAVAAIRKGRKHEETLMFKKSATDLVWSAGAKPNRSDRTRVIQELPQLLQRLRSGMTLLGIPPSEQDGHIKVISDTLADAFLAKTQAIGHDQMQAMAQRMANLEDAFHDEAMDELPLDARSIEMMLGVSASSIEIVTNGGSKPSPAMVAWAHELQPGSWFTLDHNGRLNQVQFVWRSDRKHLNLFTGSDGRSFLIQAGRLAGYLQAGLLLPQEEEALTVRATREALTKLDANPERLLG